MSKFTSFVRHLGLGSILDSVEASDPNLKAEGAAIGTVAVTDLGTLAGNAVSSVIAQKLGPAGGIANTAAQGFLQELEAWVISKINPTPVS